VEPFIAPFDISASVHVNYVRVTIEFDAVETGTTENTEKFRNCTALTNPASHAQKYSRPHGAAVAQFPALTNPMRRKSHTSFRQSA
jgi:hypothetical protein